MAALTVETGVYFVQNVGTGTVLDLTAGSNVNGTKAQGWAKRELDDVWVAPQLWIIVRVSGTDQYTFQNVNSRTFMEVSGSNVKNGTPLIGSEATGNPNQRWTIQRNSSKTSYIIKNCATGTFVDLLRGDSTDGAAINGWGGKGPSTTNAHQLWNIVRA